MEALQTVLAADILMKLNQASDSGVFSISSFCKLRRKPQAMAWSQTLWTGLRTNEFLWKQGFGTSPWCAKCNS